MVSNYKIFLSHITEEKEIAEFLKKGIESLYLKSVEVFVSSVDIRPGEKWFEKIENNLTEANLFLILASQASITRPWINFEAGAGWALKRPVIPLCYNGITPSDLHEPLRSLQALNIKKIDDFKKLIQTISDNSKLNIPKDDDIAELYNEVLSKINNKNNDINFINEGSNKDFYNWLQYKMYHLDEYCSINVALKIPMKSFDKISMWHDEEIHQLEEIVKHHKNGNAWLSYFYPLDVLNKGIHKPNVKIKRDSADLVIAKPTLTAIFPQGQTSFVEDIKNSVPINKLYKIYFDVRGYMLATVKFILNQTNFSLDIFIETISAVIDLFEEVINSRIYTSQVSKGGKYHILFEIYNVPQKIDVPFKCKGSENNIIPPVKKEELIDTLNNFELLKDFIGYFLAEKGYIGYEKNLETYLKG